MQSHSREATLVQSQSQSFVEYAESHFFLNMQSHILLNMQSHSHEATVMPRRRGVATSILISRYGTTYAHSDGSHFLIPSSLIRDLT